MRVLACALTAFAPFLAFSAGVFALGSAERLGDSDLPVGAARLVGRVSSSSPIRSFDRLANSFPGNSFSA